jgi:hypothetical protein
MAAHRHRAGRLLVATAAISLIATAGCVERRYTIRTNPPNAQVWVNGEELGPAPQSRSFNYYGPREIVLIADNHQTQRILQPVDAPWYDNLFTEFFTENLLPFTIRDEREFYYEMAPATNPPTGDLVQRAENLRSQAQQPPPERRRGFLGWLGF